MAVKNKTLFRSKQDDQPLSSEAAGFKIRKQLPNTDLVKAVAAAGESASESMKWVIVGAVATNAITMGDGPAAFMYILVRALQ